MDPPAPVLDEHSDSATGMEMANVNFHITPTIVLRIRRLHGQMLSKASDRVVVFDDKKSFIIRIAQAEVTLNPDDLAHLMNEYVFRYRGSPLRNLSFAIQGDQLKQSGIMHKGVDIPFEMTAGVSLTREGKIQIHPNEMRICRINGKGLMKALGIRLSDLLDLSKAHGASVRGNDLFLDPDSILPPPTIQGRLHALRIDGDGLVLRFGDAPLAAVSPPDSTSANYMFFHGGTLRFGKLFMVHAEMQITDADPSDPFDFSVDQYSRQLVAGYSKTLPDLGLEVFMPDLAQADAAQPDAEPKATSHP